MMWMLIVANIAGGIVTIPMPDESTCRKAIPTLQEIRGISRQMLAYCIQVKP